MLPEVELFVTVKAFGAASSGIYSPYIVAYILE
jgi:hypothetical protein